MHFVIEICFIKPKQRKKNRLLWYIENMKSFHVLGHLLIWLLVQHWTDWLCCST